MTRAPGSQRRQSREQSQVAVSGWRKGPSLSSRCSELLLWLVKIMVMGKRQKCSRSCTGLGKKSEEYVLQKKIHSGVLQSSGGRIIVSLPWIHHEVEGRGRHKNPVFRHFFSPQAGQQNHLSRQSISLTRAKTAGGRFTAPDFWPLFPAQRKESCVLCSVQNIPGRGKGWKGSQGLFLGCVQCCFSLSYHLMGTWDFAKAETLRREKTCTIAPAKAAGGICLESVSVTGRRGLPHVYTNAERPLRGRKAVRDPLCRWTGGHDGYGPLHICCSGFPRLCWQTNVWKRVSWHWKPGGGKNGTELDGHGDSETSQMSSLLVTPALSAKKPQYQ